MKIVSVNNVEQAQDILTAIDCTAEGVALMREKTVFRVIKIDKLATKAANILKQTFLSKGADAAVSCHSADLSEAYTAVIMMGTIKQYRLIIPVLKMQPWGLKKVAKELEDLLF